MPLSQLLNSSPQELNAELHLILNAIVEGVCGLDASGMAIFCNDALLNMTGYRADELIGRDFHELLHNPHDRTKHSEKECALRNALDYHQAAHATSELLWRKDGTSFTAEYWAHPLPHPSGRISYVVTLQDLTEIRQAQDVVRQSEEKFRRILGSIPDVAWTSDRHGRPIYLSPKMETIFGYTKQEIHASTERWLGRIHPEDFGRVNQAYCALFESQSVLDEEYRIRRKDGTWIWVHDRAMGTRMENGVLCADGMLRDITRRKRAELELQSKTALLEAQANSTIDGILVVDSRGQRLMHNRRLSELFHIPSDKLADSDDQNMLRYVVTLLKDPDSFMAKVNHLYKHPDETSRDEIEFKDGTILDRYSSPVIDTNAIYYGRIWTFRDITARKRNEDTLRQLSTAVEQSPVSVVITDPQGDISYVNQKFTESTGYSPEEVLGRNSRFLKSGRNAPEVYRNLWSTIAQGHEWRGEFCNQKKNGDVYWEAATIRPITNPNGAITHFLAIKEDITERKRAEEELFRSRQMLQSILDAIPQRVFWKDRNSIYVGCNRAFSADAGLDSPAAIIGKSDLDLAWSGTAELYRADDRLVMEQGSAKLNFHEHQNRPDGSVLWLQTNKLPLRDREGKVTGVVGTYEDITDRKQAENELRLTQFAVEHASDAIYRVGPQGGIVYVNGEACRASGHSREELLSLSIPDIAPLFPKETWTTFWEDIKTRGSVTFETVQKTKQGRVFPIEVTANYLELDGQEYVFSFVRDITERKRAEEEVRESNELVRLVLDSVPEAVYGIDTHGKCTFCNPSCLRLLGYQEPADLYGKDMHALIHYSRPDGTPYPVEECHIYEAFRHGQGTHIDNDVLWHRDGTSFSAEYWSQPIHRGEKIIGTVVTFLNITERKRAEKELRLAQSSLEATSGAVLWMDVQARIVYANEAACRSLGHSLEEASYPIDPGYRSTFPERTLACLLGETQNAALDDL